MSTQKLSLPCPLFESGPPERVLSNAAECTWEQALNLAEQLLADTMPQHVGSTWETGPLWESACERGTTDPIRAAALLLVLSEHNGLLKGTLPRA